MLDCGPLVGDIPTTSVTIRTSGAASIDALGRTTISTSDATRDVVAHPATTAALERLPDSDRRREIIAVYTNDPIDTTDKVYYQSSWYEVVESENYDALGDIYITLCERMENQPAAP